MFAAKIAKTDMTCAMRSRRRFAGAAINIGNGAPTDLLTVQRLIEKYRGQHFSLDLRPARVGDVRHSYADIGKARRLLGYRPVVDFATGLRKTVEWFEKRHARKRK